MQFPITIAAAFIGPLIQKFGFRRIVQVGTTLVVIGFGCSALAPNVSILYVTHGFIAGQLNAELNTPSWKSCSQTGSLAAVKS